MTGELREARFLPKRMIRYSKIHSRRRVTRLPGMNNRIPQGQPQNVLPRATLALRPR